MKKKVLLESNDQNVLIFLWQFNFVFSSNYRFRFFYRFLNLSFSPFLSIRMERVFSRRKFFFVYSQNSNPPHLDSMFRCFAWYVHHSENIVQRCECTFPTFSMLLCIHPMERKSLKKLPNNKKLVTCNYRRCNNSLTVTRERIELLSQILLDFIR